MNAHPRPTRVSWLTEILIVFLVASAASAVFWWPLPVRGGLIGGDTYNYFLPLRDFYQQGLRAGELRLWHPGIGNGVPVLGESQTGPLYPPYALAYYFFDLNRAYSYTLLFHYVLAFLGAYALARVVGLSIGSSFLASLIFVYGWFPPRACLEWAIVTGAWLPISLALLVRYLQSGQARWWGLLAVSQAMQLLAGHYNLAWVTLLALAWVALFLPARAMQTVAQSSVSWRARAWGLVAVALGFFLAAPQLLPSWELKTRSQRQSVSFAEEIAQGNVPPAYFVRSLLPTDYLLDRDQVLADLGTPTNKVEAHLYFGIVPLLLAGAGLCFPSLWGRTMPWIALSVLGGLLATGLIMPALAPLPGFGFFRYCGRYGLLCQLGVALAAAFTADRWVQSSWVGRAVLALLLGLTWADYFFVGHQVQYVTVVDPPIIERRPLSEVFAQLHGTDRVLSIDANTLALSGAACVPPYLGMGPAEYYRIWNAFPNVFDGSVGYGLEIEQSLLETGVSHLLTLAPLDSSWPVTLLWHGADPFLNPRWARANTELLYLYRYDRHPGRAYRSATGKADKVAGEAHIVAYQPHLVVIETDGPTEAELVLSDLCFPGWQVEVDGRSAEERGIHVGRRVLLGPGKHTVRWLYNPASLKYGWCISGAALLTGILLLRQSNQRITRG